MFRTCPSLLLLINNSGCRERGGTLCGIEIFLFNGCLLSFKHVHRGGIDYFVKGVDSNPEQLVLSPSYRFPWNKQKRKSPTPGIPPYLCGLLKQTIGNLDHQYV